MSDAVALKALLESAEKMDTSVGELVATVLKKEINRGVNNLPLQLLAQKVGLAALFRVNNDTKPSKPKKKS